MTFAVPDPGFPRLGRQPQGGWANLIFDNFFAENCMKLKEFGLGAGVYAVDMKIKICTELYVDGWLC